MHVLAHGFDLRGRHFPLWTSEPGVGRDKSTHITWQADVTANNDNDRALLARFGIFGPPTTAFFGLDGVERREFRLVGFVAAEPFRQHIARLESTP